MTGEERVKGPSAPTAAGEKDGLGTRTRREITSAELFGGERQIHIRHAGEIYTLRQTNKGKLILTK